MAIKESLFYLRTLIVFSQVILKLPSIPEISMAQTSILVNQNGILSGSFSLFIAISKQSPKSI